MAVDIYLKLSNGIQGESKAKGHENELDLQSWSWGSTNSSNAHSSVGSGSGKSNVGDVHVSHYIDKSSPDLLRSVCTGAHIDQADLVCRESGGKTPVEYMKLTMYQCFVTSLHWGAHSGAAANEKILESFTLNFAKFKYEYAEQTAQGTKGASKPFGYDIRAVAEA
jgi:type VI secretion system secreted protein Hcp